MTRHSLIAPPALMGHVPRPSWLICPGYICSTNCCGSTNPLPWQLKWGTLNWTLISGLGSFHFNLLEPMFGHQYHYIQFSLSSVLIQQYFLQILRAIEILKYSIFQISINLPFLNSVRPEEDLCVAGLNYPNSKPSFCIHNHTRPIIFLLEEINPLVN